MQTTWIWLRMRMCLRAGREAARFSGAGPHVLNSLRERTLTRKPRGRAHVVFRRAGFFFQIQFPPLRPF
jgi:hypothetical protein